MECLGRHIWTEYSREELEAVRIAAPSEAIRKKVRQNWDRVAKPLDSMGEFEKIIADIGAVQGTDQVDLRRKAVIIMCADNGIVEEGISQSSQEVTAAVAASMAAGRSSVGKMAAVIGADTIPIDIGISRDLEAAGLLSKKIRNGTRNFLKEPAMTEEETIRAIGVGMDSVYECKRAGYGILAVGEMGIGNTTTSSAVSAVLLGCEAAEVAGRGAGLGNDGLRRKQEVITEAIRRYGLRKADALRVLQTVGGLDIAGLTGVCIGGALYRMPVVLDGVISLTAALLAERIKPGVRQYMIASHWGKEPAMKKLYQELKLEPVIGGRLALGEGTGAVMLLSLLDMAWSVYRDSATFSDIQIMQYRRHTT